MSESSLQGGRRQKEVQEVGGAVGDESFASSWPAEKQRCLKRWKGSSKPPSTIQCGFQPGSNQEQVGGLFQVDGANGVGASAVLDPCGDVIENSCFCFWERRLREIAARRMRLRGWWSRQCWVPRFLIALQLTQ